MAFKIRKGLAYREIDGQIFIVDAAGEKLHELNAVGSLIWGGLAAGKSEARIAETVCAEFEVTAEEARKDMGVFLKDLKSKGLLTDEGK